MEMKMCKKQTSYTASFYAIPVLLLASLYSFSSLCYYVSFAPKLPYHVMSHGYETSELE